MLSFAQDRPRRYPVKVHAKISEEQDRALTELGKRTNRTVSEVIREAIQAAIEPPRPRASDSIQDDLRTCQELLQSMRTELLTVGSCLMQRTSCDVRQVSTEAEDVAAVELAAFKDRSTRRASLRSGLRAEAGP